MWALGHIGSSPGGLHLLLEEEVIDDLIDLAETCPVLSIRGYVELRGWFIMLITKVINLWKMLYSNLWLGCWVVSLWGVLSSILLLASGGALSSGL